MSLDINNDAFIGFNQILLDGLFNLEPNDPKFPLSQLYTDSKRLSGSITSLWKDVFKDIKQGKSESPYLARIQVNLTRLEDNIKKIETKLNTFFENAKEKDLYKIEFANHFANHNLILLKDEVRLSQQQINEIEAQTLKRENDRIKGLPKGLQEEAFAKLLSRQFRIIDNRGNGNCGLYSISKSLFPNLDPRAEDDVIRELRANAVNYMRNHKDKFQTYCTEDPRDYSKNVSFDEYMNIMARSGTCISEQELSALSHVLNRTIFLYRSGETTVENNKLVPNTNARYGQEYIANGKPLCIYFRSGHYMTVQ